MRQANSNDNESNSSGDDEEVEVAHNDEELWRLECKEGVLLKQVGTGKITS
jgi:hypothetical protein